MGTPGPPGGYDLHKYFRGPTQSPYSPQSGGYQPSSPGNSFHHQPSQSSYPPGSNPQSSFPPSSNAYSNLQGTNYTYSPTPPQQSGPPVYHGQQFMHYNQDHALRTQVPYSTSPFSQQASPFSQLPSSPSHSNQLQSALPVSSSSMSSQPKFSQIILPSSPASTHPLDGARLMALLTTQQSGSQGANDDEENTSIPGAPHSSPRLPQQTSDVSHGVEISGPPPPISPALPSAPPVPSASLGRLPSKPPRGRHLRGDLIIYDVDVRKPGEAQPQLEVSPITVYGSDPGLVLGRQIAVNKKFICYGLRGGTIRILNITSAQKTLLRGHNQRVSDMAFFSENAHLLASASEDGKILVRRIHEGSGEDGKLTENILLAIQLVGDWETCHPRLCWHPNTQDIIFVAIGRYVVTIHMSKAEQLNAEHPVVCRLGTPLKGISVTVQHDGVVTDLAVTLSGPFRLASASKDGTVRVWEEQKQCLSVFTPFDGNAVDAVSYLSAPQSTDRQFLLTGGPLNQNISLWALDEMSSKSGQGVWKCTQKLEFQSSSTSRPEQAFYNQIIGAPRAGLILVANAKRHAIYAIHVDFSSTSASPRMDYLAEFAVTMPILSLTVADDAVNESGEGSLKVFCVQTQAIQQYALDLSQCLPPPVDDYHSEGSTPSTPKKGLGTTQVQWTPTSTTLTALEKGHQNLTTASNSTVAGVTNVSSLSANPGIPPRPMAFGSMVEVGSRIQQYVTAEANRVAETTKSTTAVSLKDPQDEAGKPITQGTYPTFEAGSLPSTRLNTRSEVAREGLSSSNLAKPPTPPPRRRSRSRSPAKAAEMQYVPMYTAYSKHKAEKAEVVKDIWLDIPAIPAPPPTPVDMGHTSSRSSSVGDETYDIEEREAAQSSSGIKPSTFQQLRSPHLISPFDIMSLAASTKGEVVPTPDVAPNLMDVEDWQEDPQSSLSSSLKKHGGVTGVQDKVAELSDSLLVPREDVDDSTVTSFLGAFEGDNERGTLFIEKDIPVVQNVGETTTELELPGLMAMAVIDDAQDDHFLEDKQWSNSDPDSQDELKGVVARQCEAGVDASASVKGRKSKNKNTGASASQPLIPTPSQPSSAPATLAGGETESSLGSAFLDPGLVSQVATMQESLSQLVAIQRELQKQMTVIVAVPVAKEAKRLEGAFGQRMEKVVKANVDAMWARIADENTKREKQDRDRAHQVSTLLNNFVSKELPVAVERGLKQEISAFGPAVAQTLLLPLQKSVLTGVTETFQKGTIEKILPQLEKTTVAKLEASITRQLKTQFQTSGRQTLQEALRAGVESLVIPAFERSCQAMSEQLDTAFQTGMAELTSNTQQQFASADTALATTLQEVIGGASSLAKVLNEDLLDSTAKLLELVEAASAKFSQHGEIHQSKGSLPEKALSVQHVEQSLDPTIELTRLLKEGKMEEAFNKALSSGDLQLVSWLCLQLDPSSLLSTVPLPVSQGVLLSLVRHLSFDLLKNTGDKLQWIKEAALALNPNDPRLIPHMRGYLEQAYQNCHQLMGVTKVQAEQSTLRLVIHVINSLLSSCK